MCFGVALWNAMKQTGKCLFLVLPVFISSQCFAETQKSRAYSNILVVGPHAKLHANEIITESARMNVGGPNIITDESGAGAENKTTLYIDDDFPPNPTPNRDAELSRKILDFVKRTKQAMQNPYGIKYDEPSCASNLYTDEGNKYNYIIVVDANREGLECRVEIYDLILSSYK